MEYRKLVKFGTATYCVSLPKPWIRQNKLKKGDVLQIKEDEDGSLKVQTRAGPRPSEIKEITLDITGMGAEEIKRRILVSYINDFSIINLKGDIGGRVQALRDIFHEFVALEVLDLTENHITAKAFVDVSETNPLSVLHRMDLILKTMFSEMGGCFSSPSKAALIIENDFEVNRLHFFTLKLLTRGLRDIETARKWDMSPTELAFTMVFADKLEKIADRLKRLADIFTKVPFSDIVQKGLKGHLLAVETNYRDALSAFYKRDTAIAHRVITRRNEIISKLENTELTCLKDRCAKVGFGIPMTLEYLSRISFLTEDIARVVLDINPLEQEKSGRGTLVAGALPRHQALVHEA